MGAAVIAISLGGERTNVMGARDYWSHEINWRSRSNFNRDFCLGGNHGGYFSSDMGLQVDFCLWRFQSDNERIPGFIQVSFLTLPITPPSHDGVDSQLVS